MDDADRFGNIPADSKEFTAFKSILGKMLIVGRLTNPIMLRVSSFVAAKASKLLFHHLKDIESELRYLKNEHSKATFSKAITKHKFLPGRIFRYCNVKQM